MTRRVPSAALEGLLYALLVFGPFAFGAVEPWALAACESLAFLLALACFLRGRDAASPLGRWAWALPAGVAALGAVQAVNPSLADGPRADWPSSVDPYATFSACRLWSAQACVLYSVPRIVRSPDAARRFAWFFLVIGSAVAILGFAQAFTSRDMIYWVRPTIHDAFPFAAYYNRDHAANLMLLCLCMTTGLLFSKFSWVRFVDGLLPGQGREIAAVFGAWALLAIAVVFTGSRGALLAAAVTLGGMALFGSDFAGTARDRHRYIILSLLGVSAVVFFAFAHVYSGVASGARLDPSISARLTIYSDVVPWLSSARLWGTGLGSFGHLYPTYQSSDLRFSVAHAHSDWLEFILETGFIGGVAAVVGFGLFLWVGVNSWHRSRSGEMRGLIGGAIAAFGAFGVHSLFEFAAQIPANAFVFFALIGFVASSESWRDKNPKVAPSVAPSPAHSIAAVISAVMGIFMAVMPAVAEFVRAPVGTAADSVRVWGGSLRWEGSPEAQREFGKALSDLAAGGAESDWSLARTAAAYALEAALARPFDARAQWSAGIALKRLGRQADSEVFLGRASHLAPAAERRR